MLQLIVAIFTVCLCAGPLNAAESQAVPSFHTIGTLLASAQSKLGCQVSGRVDAILVEVGDSVKKGQPLVKLDPAFFEIEVVQKKGALESATIALRDAEANFLRMQKLWEKPEGETPSIPLKRFEEAQNHYQLAKVQVTQAEEELKRVQLNLDETLIKAPFDGIVTEIYIDIGEMVTSNPVKHVAEIQAMQPLLLEFSIPQVLLFSLKNGDLVAFEVEGSDSAKYRAQINRIYPSVDEKTRSVRCRAVVDNADRRLRSGSLVKVETPAS